MYRIAINPETIELHSPTHRAEIYLHGGLPNRFAIKQSQHTWFNVIAGYQTPEDAKANLTNGFRSAKLSPYACRLNQGSYTFAGQTHHCHKHTINGHAIHGLMYDADFTLQHSQANDQHARIVLQANYHQQHAGYPFSYQMQIEYCLNHQGLNIATHITNTGTQAMPLVDGWHPYFTLGGQVDDWTLRINSQQQLEFNQDLLPTGNILFNDRFQAAQSLKNTQLDNSFILNPNHQAACELSHAHLKLSIFADSSYPYLQIYIPPERNAIAIENLSGAPDAFNNGIGLNILASSETRTFSTRYVIEKR